MSKFLLISKKPRLAGICIPLEGDSTDKSKRNLILQGSCSEQHDGMKSIELTNKARYIQKVNKPHLQVS